MIRGLDAGKRSLQRCCADLRSNGLDDGCCSSCGAFDHPSLPRQSVQLCCSNALRIQWGNAGVQPQCGAQSTHSRGSAGGQTDRPKETCYDPACAPYVGADDEG